MGDQKRYTPSVSLTETEKSYLENKAKKAGVSYTRFMREVALSERSQDGEKVTRNARLKELSKAVNQLGNNLNQIARVANTTGNINLDRIDSVRKQVGLLKLEILREIN